MKKWLYLGVVTMMAMLVWFWTIRGFYTGRVAVLLGHIPYGEALWTVHPFWYAFGMTEWCLFSVIAGVMLWRAWVTLRKIHYSTSSS